MTGNELTGTIPRSLGSLTNLTSRLCVLLLRLVVVLVLVVSPPLLPLLLPPLLLQCFHQQSDMQRPGKLVHLRLANE